MLYTLEDSKKRMAAAGAVIFAVAVLAGKSNGSRKYN